MRTIASLRPFPMSAGNFVGNTIEKAAVLPISIPPRKKYLVYSLFTQGEASGLCSPTRKSVPNQGTYMGLVIVPPPEQCATTAKTSERQRAGHQKRGGGGPPPATLCVRAFSRESLDPPPGTGRGTHVAGSNLRWSKPDHLPGAGRGCVPSGWVPRKHPWGAAPRCPACPAGVPISPEKWGERGPGLRPWTPGFMARSLSLARFGDRCLWYDSGVVTSGMLRPIWDAFSGKNMLKKHFTKESLQIRVRTWGS